MLIIWFKIKLSIQFYQATYIKILPIRFVTDLLIKIVFKQTTQDLQVRLWQ